MTKNTAPASPSATSTHTTPATGIPLGITTIIQALGATGAGTTRGTTTDTAGITATTLGTTTAGTEDITEVGTEDSTTLGTTTPGIRDFMTRTITICTHTTADGMEDGTLITEASTTDRRMKEGI